MRLYRSLGISVLWLVSTTHCLGDDGPDERYPASYFVPFVVYRAPELIPPAVPDSDLPKGAGAISDQRYPAAEFQPEVIFRGEALDANPVPRRMEAPEPAAVPFPASPPISKSSAAPSHAELPLEQSHAPTAKPVGMIGDFLMLGIALAALGLSVSRAGAARNPQNRRVSGALQPISARTQTDPESELVDLAGSVTSGEQDTSGWGTDSSPGPTGRSATGRRRGTKPDSVTPRRPRRGSGKTKR